MALFRLPIGLIIVVVIIIVEERVNGTEEHLEKVSRPMFLINDISERANC